MEYEGKIIRPVGAEFTFEITPKASITELIAANAKSKDKRTLRTRVSLDIIKNAEEVIGGEGVDEVLSFLKYRVDNAIWNGEDALVRGHSSMVGRIAIALGVGMDDPVMVSASSDFFARNLTTRANFLVEEFAKIGTEIKFTPGTEEERKEERRKELERIIKLSEEAGSKIDAFIDTLPRDEYETKITIIRSLVRVPSNRQIFSPNHNLIGKVLKLLTAGKIDQAAIVAERNLYFTFST